MALKKSDLKVGAIISRTHTYKITEITGNTVRAQDVESKKRHSFNIKDNLLVSRTWKLVSPTPKKKRNPATKEIAKTDPAARAQELWDAL